MKIQCNSSELAKACLNVQRTVSNKSTIPALEGILIDAKENLITLTGYDLEVGSVATIDAEVSSQGKIVLNAKNLCDILRMLPDDVVTIDCDERNISKIKSGETEYSLIGTSADDYPELPSISKYTSITLELGTIKDMIKKTIFSVSTSERNPVHTGVKFEINGGKLYSLQLTVQDLLSDAKRLTSYMIMKKHQIKLLSLLYLQKLSMRF